MEFRVPQFRERLTTPQYLDQITVARIRKILREATEDEFLEYMSVSSSTARKILSFWELAQLDVWDASSLERFFNPQIYEDRELVKNRLELAIKAGHLPEIFSREAGLAWIEGQNILIGQLGEWVRRNIRHRLEAFATYSQLPAALPKPAARANEPLEDASAEVDWPSWALIKPKRFHGYTEPLYRALEVALSKGEARPTVHDVLALFKLNLPSQIAKVLPGEGFDYYTTDFDGTKHANLKAIRSAINRMTPDMSR